MNNWLSPYLSALDFWNSQNWNIKFDELDFFPSLNWNFLPAVACKIQVWNRLKIKFIKLDVPTYFKLENCKNRVQIDMGSDIVHFKYIWKWPLSEQYCTCLFLINGFWSHLLSEFSFEYIYISFLDFFDRKNYILWE